MRVIGDVNRWYVVGYRPILYHRHAYGIQSMQLYILLTFVSQTEECGIVLLAAGAINCFIKCPWLAKSRSKAWLNYQYTSWIRLYDHKILRNILVIGSKCKSTAEFRSTVRNIDAWLSIKCIVIGIIQMTHDMQLNSEYSEFNCISCVIWMIS